jgi:hypothetical protein
MWSNIWTMHPLSTASDILTLLAAALLALEATLAGFAVVGARTAGV